VVAAAGSPAEQLASRGRALFVPVPQGRQPRASVWSLSTPLVIAADALGLVQAPAGVIEEAAVVLEGVATRCRVDADTVVNAAKTLATELEGAIPVVWGTSPLAGVAAYRFACQLNENAKVPATWGVLPEANHNQVVAFDGPFAGRGLADLFHDPYDDDNPAPSTTRIRVVLLRDAEEHPQVARRAAVTAELAEERGIGLSALQTTGVSSFERVAELIGTTDFASAYLAVLQGIDPTPVDSITALKERIRP
jgi:glucose/mannose-6-phosphate isomerase